MFLLLVVLRVGHTPTGVKNHPAPKDGEGLECDKFSKAALDAWTRCAASEFVDRGIEFTTINMPLVKTPMIAPTKLYDNVPTLTPDDAGNMIVDAIVHRQVRIATRLGVFGQVLHAAAPRIAQIVMNTAYRMFPDSPAAKCKTDDKTALPTADQIAFSQIMRGIHF